MYLIDTMTQISSKLTPYRFLLFATVLLPVVCYAHSPHDVISDVASASIQGSKSHTFILITDQVFRSDDDGASWKNLVNGLNHQHSFSAVEVSPAYESDKTLFVASSGDGIYRSTNRGDSWRKVNAGLGSLDIDHLSISAQFGSDGRLLAAAKAGGVWRSVDRGISWQMVLTDGVGITSFAEIAGLHDQYVVIAGDSEGKIWRSEDNGRLWEVIHELHNAGGISSVAGVGDHIYVGTERDGLYQSRDGGGSFAPVSLPRSPERSMCLGDSLDQAASDVFVTSVAVNSAAAGESRVLATTWFGGVLVSEDSARTWSVWHEGLSCDSQADALSVPHFQDIEIVNEGDGKTVYWLAAYDGLFRRDGEQVKWEQRETLPLGLIKGLAVTAGKDQPLAVALSTYGGGFYLVQTDHADWTIGNKGLLTTRLTGLEFSPNYSEDNVIYAGAIRKLLKSADRGQSWQRINLHELGIGTRVLNKLNSWGVPTSWLRSSDPRSSSPIFPTHIVALPKDPTETVLMATRYHGLMAFAEATESIEPLWSGADQIMNSLIVSPDFERDHTMFSSIRGKGVFRSNDGGLNWIEVNRGLDFVGDWSEGPERGEFRRDVYIAISPDFKTDNTLFAGSPAGDGLYASYDRGNSWVRLNPGFGVSPTLILAISLSPDFKSDNTLMLSLKGRGLFRSRDRGQTFDEVGPELIAENASIELLEYSPDFANDGLVVAASDEKLFLSLNSGDSWGELPRPVRYEDMRDVVIFNGDWVQRNGEQYSALTETVTSANGGTVRIRFVGAGIRWIGSQGPGYGSAGVYVDGGLVETVSCRAEEIRHMQTLVELQELGFGPHTIEIRTNPQSAGLDQGLVGIDAFDVLP